MRKTTCIFVFLVIVSLLAADGVQPPGSGTSTNPYLISSLDHLLWVSTNSTEWSKNFRLDDNIDASATSSWNGDEGFSPIGNASTPFTGNFYGYNKTIDHLTIDRASNHQGLFGYIEDAFVTQVRLTNVSIDGAQYVGGLVGYADEANIMYSHVEGDISGASSAGGLVGEMTNTSQLSMCDADVTVNCSSNNGGGVAGAVRGGSSVWRSHAIASVSGSTTLGGVVGELQSAALETCYCSGTVHGTGYNVGGLVGNTDASSVSDCYAWSDVTGSATRVGGLIGCCRNSAEIEKCYSIGAVAGSTHTGGLAGQDLTSDCTIADAFWNTGTSGQSTSAGGAGLTIAEMQTSAPYLAEDGTGWTKQPTEPRTFGESIPRITTPIPSSGGRTT